MQISVIIPTYNRAHMLAFALESVLKQSYPIQEIIVVDDASEDDTRDRLDEFRDRVRIIRLEQNHGVSHARNQGIQASNAEWLAFLDSDDRWHREKLETQVVYHEHNPAMRISQCDEIWIRDGVRVNPMRKHAKQGGWIFRECLPRCIVSPSAVLIHRSVFEQVGLFDENLPACEDYDLWLRIALHFEIGYLPKPLLTRYGGHDDQLSRKYWGMDRFRIKAMEKHLETPMERDSQEALLQELSFKCKVVAEGAQKRENDEMAQRFQEKRAVYQARLESLKDQ